MQYKVPQKIDLEDKIVGPLTLKQFLYLMSGGMIIYVALNFASTAVFFMITIPVAIVSLALAFLKIQDQPFAKFLISLLLYFFRPRERVWQKNLDTEKFAIENINIDNKPKPEFEIRSINKSELEQLAQDLDIKSLKQIELDKQKANKSISHEQKTILDKIYHAKKPADKPVVINQKPAVDVFQRN